MYGGDVHEDDLRNAIINMLLNIPPEAGANTVESVSAEEACPIEPSPHQQAADSPDSHYLQQKIVQDLLPNIAQEPEWTHKNIQQWTPQDTIDFILQTAKAKNLELDQIPFFKFVQVSGLNLISMNYFEFMEKLNADGNYSVSPLVGSVIYDELQKIKCDFTTMKKSCYMLKDQNYGICGENNNLTDVEKPRYDSVWWQPSRSDSDACNPAGVGYSLDPSAEGPNKSCTVVKRAPGRPKGSGKNQNKKLKNASVPEFLRDLLLNKEHCPSIIKWEDYDIGKFRFVNATAVAKLWGVLKRNQNMNFEKLSRAMRYHYKKKVLVSSLARLVYQFGSAHNTPKYYTSNPNFNRSS